VTINSGLRQFNPFGICHDQTETEALLSAPLADLAVAVNKRDRESLALSALTSCD
jgi:hypothetical protein